MPSLRSSSSRSIWSRIPPELAAEIAAHNADDVASLRAMSLVSKGMRSFAIEHLFTVIHFACAQDLTFWGAMIRRTPRLQHIVKKVKFSDPNKRWMKRHRKVRSPKPLSSATVPPKVPIMPNVRVVEWEEDDENIVEISATMATAYMTLFPNTEELYLSGMTFDGFSEMSLNLTNSSLDGFDELATLLGTCAKLRVLSFRDTDVDEGLGLDNGKRPKFNLTALEELRVIECGDTEFAEFDFLVQLVEASRPNELKSMTFAQGFDFGGDEPCSLLAMDKLLRLAAPSLVDLTILLDDTAGYDLSESLEMLSRLPPFPTLDTLSLVLDDRTQEVLNALQSAPKLTRLDFRMIFAGDDDDDIRDDFRDIIGEAFPWGGSESMRSVLTRKFPLTQRIGFYFCVPRNSAIHFRRGFRRRMERELKDRLEETNAGLGDLLEVGWLDTNFDPVVYSKTNGKPTTWKFPPGSPEPPTEESDCESDTDSDLDGLERVIHALLD
ncbi:hypothetical protein MVEN_01514100 [Mycena venus]|uniref:F-box domain-containing protein n=1 Tax=Mycena venus TaxID=2733690 RepID=A0A8H7CRJ4_9AGAR|nr:hypothetical protein MVEN_01514100 [Mycena venus]